MILPDRQRLRRGMERLRSLYATVRYSWGGQLEHLFLMGESQDRLAERARTRGEISDPFASPALESLWERRYFPARYDIGELLHMPPETLGGAYARHMTARALRPDFFDQVSPRDRTHYLRLRIRQTHDIWHVLAGFDTDMAGEVGLQGFYFGQFPNGQSALILASWILKTALRGSFGELAQVVDAFCEGHRTGRNAEPLLAVHWEDMWGESLESVRERFRIDRPRCSAGLIGQAATP
jgi:ubiquinone biosynthesis protein COQ4